jgi:hypothetical protein
MKSQLSMEYYISLTIFILFIGYIFFQLILRSPQFIMEVENERLRSESYQISELLVNNPGEPINWVTSAGNWLTGYSYRKQITIAGSTAGAQTNYQMKLNAYYSSIPLQRLLGTTSTGNANTDANRFVFIRLQAQNSGTINKIRIYAGANGNVKVALYNDSGGSPSTLLAANNTGTACTSGQWNTVGIPDTIVAENSYYWIAAIADTDSVLRYNSSSGSGTSLGKDVSYSGFSFPDPAGSGFTSYTYDRSFDAFGILINSVSLDSHFQTDFDDIRFTKSDGTTQLDYWIESKTDGDNATVWVEFDSIPALPSTANFYIYYGSASASSGSNGTNTFPFFDDFSDTTLDTTKWYIVSGTSYTVSNSILKISVGAIGLQNALGFNINDGYMTEGRIRYDTNSEAYYSGVLEISSSQFIATNNGNSDATILYMVNSPASSTAVNTWIGSGSSSGYNIASSIGVFTMALNTWYVLGDEATTSTSAVWMDYSRLNNYATTWTKNMRYVSLGAFHGSGTYNVKDTSYDWVRVRKYVLSGPTFGSWGSEERVPETEIQAKRIGLSSNLNKTNLLSEEKIYALQSICNSDYEKVKTLLGTEYYFSINLTNMASGEKLLVCNPPISVIKKTKTSITRIVALNSEDLGELTLQMW